MPVFRLYAIKSWATSLKSERIYWIFSCLLLSNHSLLLFKQIKFPHCFMQKLWGAVQGMWSTERVKRNLQNEKNQTTKWTNKTMDFSSQCLKIHNLICTHEETYAKSSSIVPGTGITQPYQNDTHSIKIFSWLITYCWIEGRTLYSSDPFSISWAQKRHDFAFTPSIWVNHWLLKCLWQTEAPPLTGSARTLQ